MKNARANLLITACVNLQREKEQAYGDEWKQFGFISSFFNTYRKFARLRQIWQSGWKPTRDDSRLDTLIDLLNYCLLNVLLHVELHQEDALRILRGNTAPTLTAEMLTANEKGFRCLNLDVFAPLLAREMKSFPESELDAVVGEILTLGHATIEEWLKLNALAVQGGEAAAAARRQANQGAHAPAKRVRALLGLAALCAHATLLHSEQAPQEWESFIAKYVNTPAG